LKMGRRKSAVTTQEKVVSCANEGEMCAQKYVWVMMVVPGHVMHEADVT
jgi:hypothetical protein